VAIVRASDGLPARPGGSWTREKLVYLKKYATAFMVAMASKRDQGKWDRLVYIDLLAGPGLGIDEHGQEFKGSPLIALAAKPRFNRLFLGESSRTNFNTLRKRVPQEEQQRITFLPGDCNETVKSVVAQLTPKTLGLAFVDPEGFEVKFSTFQQLARRRIDIVYLFPSGIGIRRNIVLFTKTSHSVMDDFWGGSDWRSLPFAKRALGKPASREELRLGPDSVSAFKRKVSTLSLAHYDESDPVLRNNQGAVMYHLLFFSHHAAGLKIWRGIKQIEASGQRPLSF
jgi:three-Cys-motif partner protein